MSPSMTIAGTPGRARSMPGWPAMVWAQVRLNHTALVRQRGLAFSVLTLPLFFVVVYTINPTAHETIGGVSTRAYVGVGTLAMGCLAAFMSVSAAAVYRREERIYKRLRGTALPVGAIFAGDVAHAVLVGLVQEVLSAGYLIVVLHAPMPSNIPLILVASLIGSVAFCVLALGVSGLLPSNEVAQLASVPVLLIGALGSGMAIPLSALPGWARGVCEVLAPTPIVRAVRTGWFGRDFSAEPAKHVAAHHVGLLDGFQVSGAGLGVALLWIAVGLWLTRRFFRWDPRRA
jgi:ABC-2 type transport system permease protein